MCGTLILASAGSVRRTSPSIQPRPRVTPCSCSAQRSRVESAEAERDRARNLAASLEAECARLSETVARLHEKVTTYRKACNDDLNRGWNDTDHGGRLACDYVLQELDALTGPTETGDEPA